MTTTTASIEIDRPADVVFDYVADMANNPTWQQGQRACVWTSDAPIRVGSTYHQTAAFLGKTLVSEFEVVDYEPGRSIRIVTTGGSMPIDVTRTVTPIGAGRCRVSATVTGEPPRVFRMLGPVLSPMVRRSVNQDYRRLKRLLEDR